MSNAIIPLAAHVTYCNGVATLYTQVMLNRLKLLASLKRLGLLGFCEVIHNEVDIILEHLEEEVKSGKITQDEGEQFTKMIQSEFVIPITNFIK